MSGVAEQRPVLLVLASTYPRWKGDPEPGFVHELSKRLTDRFRVIVLGPHAPDALPRGVLDGVEVVRYRYAPERWETLVNDGGIVTNLKLHRWKLLLVPGFVLMQAWWAWRLCRREKVDVVHAHWLIPQGLIAACLQLLPGRRVPFVVTSHGADLFALRGRVLQTLKRFVLRRAARATVVSHAMQEAAEMLIEDLAKVAVIPMGVDLDGRFTPDPRVQRLSGEILFVGRLVEKKGLRHLINAMSAVLRRFPDACLTIAGFGPQEAALKAQADALGLSTAIRFVGAVPQSELPIYYRRAALFVAPFVEAEDGDREGLGLVTIEAIACGCPVVVGDLPAVRDIVGSPEYACLRVPSADEAALAEAVIAVLSDPVGSAAIVSRLRAHLATRFDWCAVAHAYGELLTRVSASPGTDRLPEESRGPV